MKKFNRQKYDSEFSRMCCGDDVMSVIRLMPRDDWKRDNLMRPHLELVYDFAHSENKSIDFGVKNAGWLKPNPSTANGRTILRLLAALSETDKQHAGSSSSQSADGPVGDTVSNPAPAPSSESEVQP